MRRSTALAVLAFALVSPPAAAGDGVPPVGTDAGRAGVTMPGLAHRWVTVRTRGRTLIAAIERRGGRIDAARTSRAPLFVPAVAYDMSATGLSADGTTLVLAHERRPYPARRSSFTVFDAKRLLPRSAVTLRGDFTLDAVSPDGGRLYFIEAKSPTRYAVRAYDVAKQRLLPGAIVDPEEADEPMEGIPLTRAVSRDGRWAYTLYDENGAERFVHALDTKRGVARCIDLVGIPPAHGLHVGGDGTLIVTTDGGNTWTVDPRTFAVHEPGHAVTPLRPAEDETGWIGVTAGVALLVLLAFGAVAAGRRRPVRDNVQSYAATRLERDLLRADVGAPGSDGQGGARPARAPRR
jgi:hypothetical protein